MSRRTPRPDLAGASVKKLLILLLLVAASVAGSAYWLGRRGEASADGDRYTFAAAEYGRIADVVSATGTVQARDVFPVGTELAGKVTEVLADYNQVVKEGDVLLRLDDRMARQKLLQAEVAVDQARVFVRQAEATRDAAAKAVQRVKELSPEVRRQTDLDIADGHLRAAEVGVEAARVRVREAEEGRRQADLALKLHTVRAPVLGPLPAGASASLPAPGGVGTVVADSGPAARPDRRTFTVLDRHVVLNQEVGPPASGQLFTLAGPMDYMQVVVQVAEGDVNKIRRGLSVDFTVPGGEGDVAFKGTVEEVRLMPTSDRGAVFYKVVVGVRNERDPVSGEWRLRPGLTASTEIVRRAHEPTWKMPAAALNFQPDPSTLTDSAKSRLAEATDARWKPVWVAGPEEKPWPVFVRLGGTDARGEPGIQDSQASEVLEWDAALRPAPDPKDLATYPRVIIGAPPPRKSGLFNAPAIKF